MAQVSNAYTAAEQDMDIPPVSERGRRNLNPDGIGFWALVAEDFATHERKIFEQGFWAIFVHRFGNWRMGQPKIIRAPATLLYRLMFKLIEWICGISLWYTVRLGRRVRIWHHSGMSLGARAIGNDVHIRQNTTFGVAQTGQNDQLPIIGDGADIGAGACIVGSVYVGKDAKIGANALVITDVPSGATAIGNPAQILGGQEEPPLDSPAPTVAPPMTEESTLETALKMGRIALLGSANLDSLAMDLKDVAARDSLEIETYVPPFGQALTELLLPDSALSQWMDGSPTEQAVLIVERAEAILGEAYSAPLLLTKDNVQDYLAEALEPMLTLIREARARLKGPIFVLGLAVTERSSLGMADGSEGRGLSVLVAHANEVIRAEMAEMADAHFLDGNALVAEVGRAQAHPGQFWHLGRMPFSSSFNNSLSRRVLGGLLALRGKTARLLILDLDNTLWGGVLGEDGMEGLAVGPSAYPGSAYSAFQEVIKALSQRGIALAVASKNDEDLALEMISSHPEMTLRPEDIVSHRIGWSEKSIGIGEMLDEIGLGASSAMFIDDNPVEREKARKNVPGLIVPPFPTSPEDLAGWLLDSPFLEAMSLTASDLKRSAQYSARAKEVSTKRSFQNVEDFYRDLDMTLTFEPYGAANQQRVLQLFVKTNQFNATLRRHDAAAVQHILDTGGEIFAIGVADRHSSYELMGVIVLRPDSAMKADYQNDDAVQVVSNTDGWWVDSIMLSCRILGRTVEDAIVVWAMNHLAKQGATGMIGQVIEAPRNTPVRDLFKKCGMETLETDLDLGAGGLYRQDLSQGAQDIPDYFTISDAPPAPLPDAAPRRPRAPGLSTSDSVAAAAKPNMPSTSAVTLDPNTDARLAAVFRQTFQLDTTVDVNGATMETVEAWDSLGHLRLAMEIERSFKIRLPASKLAQVNSYASLRAAMI